MKLLLTLIIITFLFNGCEKVQPTPALEPEKIYVEKSQPVLKNLKRINSKVPQIKLYKKDHPNEQDMYIVSKTDLIEASKNTQNLRKITHDLDYQVNFYIYQNNKFNNTNKDK